MRWLLANPLRTLPPLGLVAVGALVGVAGLTAAKKTARSLAVLTVRGALAVGDTVKETGESINQFWKKKGEKVQSNQINMEEPDTTTVSLQPLHYNADTGDYLETATAPPVDVAKDTPAITSLVHESPSNEVKNNSPKTKNDKKL